MSLSATANGVFSSTLDGLRRSLRLRRAFFIGAVTGFLWITPLFGPPESHLFQYDQVSPIRVARILAPLMIWLVITRQDYRSYLRAALGLQPAGPEAAAVLRLAGVCLLFSATLGLVGAANGTRAFLISAVLPLVVSMFVVTGFAAADRRTLRYWLLGIGLAAAGYLLAGIASSGLGVTSYYGRPRVLLGFHQPMSTASVFVAAMFFVSMVSRGALEGLSRARRAVLVSAFYVLGAVALLAISSRNVLVSLSVGTAAAWVARRTNRHVRFAMFLLVFALPGVILCLIFFGSPRDPLWALLDQFSSYRLNDYQRVMGILLSQADFRILLAPGASYNQLGAFAGFAATDSVFLSLMLQYGVIAPVAFSVTLLILGWRLSRRREYSRALGSLTGLLVLYNVDAQGLTVSNLIAFLAFAYAVRTAVRRGA